MDLLGGAAIPPRFRRGSVWILPRFRRGSARFRAVPRGSVPKSNKIAAQHEQWTHGMLCSEKCVNHSSIWISGSWTDASLGVCCTAKAPLKIRSCSLFLKLKKGRGRGIQLEWWLRHVHRG